ncbi:hypothetical protein LTR06_001634 [Exophiala xenobiotica]|nr:hypothetical protein LTR06_001634 [Exophiala xenobiotica]
MTGVSELCRDLGIKHPLDQHTCIGYGQKKPNCGSLAAEHNRQKAVDRLEKIADKLTNGDSPSDVMTDLHRVAKLLHCVRNHQYQADDKAQEWKRKLDRAGSRRGGARQQRPSRSRGETGLDTSNSRPERRSADSLTSARDEELVNELAQRYLGARRLIEAVEALTGDRHVRTATTADWSLGQWLAILRDYHAEGEGEDNDSGFSGSDAESEEDDSATTSAQVSYQRRQQRRSPTPSPPSVSSSSSSNASGSSRRSAASETECGICLDRLRRRDDRWRCTTCHNATHTDCFDQWMASSPEDNVRCIYW